MIHIGKALVAVRKAKKLRPKEVYLRAGLTSSAYGEVYHKQFPRKNLEKHLQGLNVSEAAVLLWAIDIDQIPQHLKVAFITIRERILK